jgi:DNA helicase-2/ATP-dependent DNA helicase PcrA
VLERNYRSTQAILDGAHALIAADRQRKEKSLWTEREGGAPIAVVETGSEQEEALAVVGEIARLEREGDARPGDCAVMYRTNAQSRALEEAFNRYGMPYRLIGGLRFWARREVKDVVAYLRVVQNPFDDVSFTRIINVPSRAIGQRTVEELVGWATRQGVPLYSALQMAAENEEATDVEGPRVRTRTRNALRTFLGLLHELMEESERVPVTRLLDRMAERTGYRQALLEEEGGEERWENVRELRTVASQFQEMEGQEGLVAFLESATLASDVDKIEDGVGAATLITLHQAKGLEFPVVFMVGLEEGLLPHRRSFDDPAQTEEERRLCYVGMTRAKERLYLLRAARRSFMGASMVNPPSRYLADIPARLVEGPGRGARTAWGSSPIAPPAIDLRAGDHVRHGTFGEGIVIGVLPKDGDAQVTVAFKGEAGVKRLLYSFAGLDKVN